MSLFEFLMILLSIIIGLGLTVILTGIAGILLMFVRQRTFHYVVVHLVPVTIALDTMVINYLVD